MNLGIVVYGPLDSRSGGYLYDRMLVDRLIARGHTVKVFSQRHRGYLRGVLRGLFPDRGIMREIESIDLLLEDELNHAALLGTNRRVRRLSYGGATPPVVAIVHHLRSSEVPTIPPARWFFRAAERSFLKQTDGMIYNSKTTKNVVTALLGAATPSVVAPPASTTLPCDPPTAQEVDRRYLPGDPLRLLFVGNLIPRKGLLPLLQALRMLRRSGELRDISGARKDGRSAWRAALTIAGREDIDSSYRRRLRRVVAGLGNSCTVRFLGRVADQTLCDLYRSHNVLTVPSFYEGYGMVYAEAQRYGMAVVAGRGGAGPEVVEDGVTGFLVDPAKPKTIADALRRFLDAPSLAAQMGRRGLESPVHSWDATADRVEVFLQEILWARQ